MVWLLALVNLASWIRGLSQLRCFQSTRIFIFLVVKVTQSLGAFLIITLVGILALSSTYSIMHDEGTFFTTFKDETMKAYLLTLGTFDTNFENSVSPFLFLFGSMFLTLTMLNLVVALMSDAYAEVMGSITEQDAADTNLMIIDVEKMFFQNRQRG